MDLAATYQLLIAPLIFAYRAAYHGTPVIERHTKTT